MDIPDAMIEFQVENMIDDFARRLQSQGLAIEQYMQYTGLTLDKLKEDMKPQAIKRIQSRLVLEKIAEVEDIQVTDEDINNEIEEMAKAYMMEADKLKEYMGDAEKENMKADIAVKKAADFVTAEAKEV